MGKQRTPKQILDGAANLVSQVNSLLVSTANPSDDTSLSIRLSMVKVSKEFILITDEMIPDGNRGRKLILKVISERAHDLFLFA